MSNYNIAIAWNLKDALADSDPDKIISGDDLHTEFTAVKTAVNTKADLNGSATEAFSASTPTAGDNTTKVATTAFVVNALTAKQDTLTNIADTTSANGYGTRTVSTAAPTGGSDGDIWYRY